MNNARLDWNLVQILVHKDWYFMRQSLVAYLGAGLLGLFLISAGSEGTFYAGAVLLFTVLISLGIHLAMATVVQERTQQTLAFVMTLPISPREYTMAKMLANLVIFLVPWLTTVAGSVLVLHFGLQSGGLIPFALVVLTEIFLAYLVVLAVALVTESEGWAIATMVTMNLFFQGFLYVVSHMPGIADTMKGATAVWSPTALGLLTGEMALIATVIGMTFRRQGLKTDFI